jgi:UDP-N-acetylmuramoyl-tripeptide--D-alanyl-D-alanine ligase
MKAELLIRTYTPREIARITNGRLIPEKEGRGAEIRFVCTDSREAEPGVLFCAIKGERTDGHDYIPDAVRAGAACILCSSVPEDPQIFEGCAAVVVPDVQHAIGDLAAEYRTHAKARVVAVTGSVGKTTTKEFIAAVAGAAFRTHKTVGNHNNELGLSMTLFTLKPDDEVSVLEMGMSDFGEIGRLSLIARPDIGVVTNIGTSHLEFLGTRENICYAKLEIRNGMKDSGTLFLNGDEPLLTERISTLTQKVRLFSIESRDGDYRAVNIRSMENGMMFDLICGKRVVTNVQIPVLGRHNVRNALAAYAVGRQLGIQDDVIRSGLLAFVGADMRQKIYDMNGVTVIEDCYNASPESMRAALDVLASVAARGGGRSAALLGDMLELGEDSRLLHDQIGVYAASVKVNLLFCYGRMADVVAAAAIKNGIRAENVFVSLDTDDPQTMADMILHVIRSGDVLLVKASRAVAAERVLECMRRRRKKRKR